jgi:hypothetical protein
MFTPWIYRTVQSLGEYFNFSYVWSFPVHLPIVPLTIGSGSRRHESNSLTYNLEEHNSYPKEPTVLSLSSSLFPKFQVSSRTKNRHQRLHEALNNLQGNAAMTEDLLEWLTAAQNDLHQKESVPLPEDLPTTENLLKEHSVSSISRIIFDVFE